MLCEFTITITLSTDPTYEPRHSHVNIRVQWQEREQRWAVCRELVWSDCYAERPRRTTFLDYHLAKRAAIMRALDELGLDWPLGEALPELDDLRLLCTVTVGDSS